MVKLVQAPAKSDHPQGWNTNFSHQRKMKSYQVEAIWYAHYNYMNKSARIPRCFASSCQDNTQLLFMEDLKSAGYNRTLESLRWPQIEACVKWLANFHARFMKVQPKGLWETGSYWHLATRPDELERLQDERIKITAGLIDKKLSNATYKTLIHGDAKAANFCFSEDLEKAAAVDFQYVGGGCGIKDLAYFISSCLESKECFKREEQILDMYFYHLKGAINKNEVDYEELESEWRALYPFAWADFYRFLKGWSPGHWKDHEYSASMAAKAQQQILAELEASAREACLQAVAIIKNAAGANIEIKRKKGASLASSVVTDVDHRAQKAILKTIGQVSKVYDFGLLAEELEDDKSRLEKDYFWSIDPLDGTLPFTEGRPGYAVSIALVARSGQTVLAAVYDPTQDNFYSASIGGAAFKNKKPFKVSPSPGARKKLFVDHSSRQDPRFKELGQEYEILPGGGAVMNSIWCVENAPALFLKFPKEQKGGGSLWDYAAVSLIVNEAGGKAGDFHGEPIELNRKESTYLNHRGIRISS